MAHVLLVEDEPLIRMMAEEDLAELGHCVTAAADGDTAFALPEYVAIAKRRLNWA